MLNLSDLDEGWRGIVERFLMSAQGLSLWQRIEQRRQAGALIYPPDPFRALRLTPFDQVKVVIVGQDPYHGPKQADGLAFSVRADLRTPPSLRNIFKEVARTEGGQIPKSGSLESWARQGVLLLNTSLTVEDGKPASHSHWGWEVLTGEIIQKVAAKDTAVVFLLWGAHAQSFDAKIREVWHRPKMILKSNHPSPLSAARGPIPFLGNNHFQKTNAWLTQKGEKPIDWVVKDAQLELIGSPA